MELLFLIPFLLFTNGGGGGASNFKDTMAHNFQLELGPNGKPFLFTMFYLLVHPYRQNVTCQKQRAASPIFTLESGKEFEQG